MVSRKLTTTSISIVIPLFNEEAGVPSLVAALNKLVKSLPNVEILFINDGSTDKTALRLQENKIKHARSYCLNLSRNFGHQAALLAGIAKATGDIVVTMDGDLQHPPQLIIKMIEQHRLGADIVFTQRSDTPEIPWVKRVTSSIFYVLLNFLSETPVTTNASDFRSMNRKAVNALLSLPEKRLFLRGMVQWLGYRTVTLPFVVGVRKAGKSQYSFGKMLKLAIFGITSFSSSLLYISALLSLFLFVLASFYGAYVIYIASILKIAVSGWASMLVVVLTLGALLSLSMSIMGLYLAAIYEEIKHRPHYIVASTEELSSLK